VRTIHRQQNVGDFIVRGISFDPQLFGRMSAFTDLSYTNELVLLEPGEYQILGIFVEKIHQADAFAAKLYEALAKRVNVFERRNQGQGRNPVLALFDQADSQTWDGVKYALYTINDVLQEVDQIIGVLNGAALVILVVLFVIIMVGITNTFRRIMYERVKEIGTMRALGMQKRNVLQLFLWEAFLLTLTGVCTGLVIASLAMVIVASIDIGVDSAISILLKNGHFTFRVLPRQITLNVAIVASLTLLAAFFPSWRAARKHPVDALRAE
jgi:putative ABC transport system permease protein